MVFFSLLGRFFFSYALCSTRPLHQFSTLLSGVAKGGVSAPAGNTQNRRRLRLQQRARRHTRTTRRHLTIPPPITTNCTSPRPARLHHLAPIPYTPTQIKKQQPSRTRGEDRARNLEAGPGGHGGRPQQEPAHGVAGARPQRAQNEEAHRQGARASGSGRRTAREQARAAGGGGPGESTRVRRMAARREGARARGTGRRAAREHGRGPVRRARREHWHAKRVADREEARARGRRRRTGREHARAAEGGTLRGSAGARRCAGAGEAASDRRLSLRIAHGPMRVVDLPLVATRRVTRRRRGVDIVNAAAWRPRGWQGRRDVPTGPRRTGAPAARSAGHAGSDRGAIDFGPLVHVRWTKKTCPTGEKKPLYVTCCRSTEGTASIIHRDSSKHVR